MKIPRILFAIISLMTCAMASAEIDVNVLTRGGWETEDGTGIYFFNPDGTAVSCGYTVTPIKWTLEPDGILKLTYDDDIAEYVMDINNGIMYWRNGMKSFHFPFAEKNDEISRREKHNLRDDGWRVPHSANALSAQLYKNSYVSDALDGAILFASPDICFISDFVHNDINGKYQWQAIDSVSVKFIEIGTPYKNHTAQIRMYPGAFDFVKDDSVKRFILNANNEKDALCAMYNLCVMPFGCPGFFTDNINDVMSYLHKVFPENADNPRFSIFIDGRKWECNGIKVTSDRRGINYVNYPSEKDSTDESFESMSSLLVKMFKEVRSPLGEHTRMYVAPSYGTLDPDANELVITLIKLAPGENLKRGSVILDIRSN